MQTQESSRNEKQANLDLIFGRNDRMS